MTVHGGVERRVSGGGTGTGNCCVPEEERGRKGGSARQGVGRGWRGGGFSYGRMFAALGHHLGTLAEASGFLLLLLGPVERALHCLVFQVQGLTLEPDSLKFCFKMLGSSRGRRD